jgi:hypothetical protein
VSWSSSWQRALVLLLAAAWAGLLAQPFCSASGMSCGMMGCGDCAQGSPVSPCHDDGAGCHPEGTGDATMGCCCAPQSLPATAPQPTAPPALLAVPLVAAAILLPAISPVAPRVLGPPPPRDGLYTLFSSLLI